MVECMKCGNVLPEGGSPVASISGSILGDECTECYFLCERCGFYTVIIHWDLFAGGEELSKRGPLSESEAVKQIDSIRRCAEPWNKKCRCDAHRSYFDGMLD
jgi:hypothetical protein